MHPLIFLTLDQNVRQVRKSAVDAFAAQISGGALSRADHAYNEAREVCDATIDRRLAPIARWLAASGYVNFLTKDVAERVAASYGTNYVRLQAVQRRFDPGNLFRMSLNIVPAAVPQFQASP